MAKESWVYQFEAHVGKVAAQHKLTGLSVGLARNGEAVYTEGFGYRNAEEGLPCTPTTVHGIGSITKSFTAVAIMQLQDRGQLKVTDPVVKYLPEFRTPDRAHTPKVTIHDFLTHTSGLPPLPTLWPAMGPSYRNDPAKKSIPITVDVSHFPDINTYEELMEQIARTEFKLLGAPGTRFSYSNDGFGLLGAIIERVSGISYAQFVEEHILKPAGMVDSTFDVEKLLKHPETTMLYGPNPDKGGAIEAQPGWWQSPSQLGAGFLRSTVPDMLRYMEIYRTGGLVGKERLLSQESVAAMTRPQIEMTPGMFYGYGLMVVPRYHGLALVEHGGNVKGVSAQVAWVPERGITGVCLTNVSGAPAPAILHGGINLLLGLPVETKRVVYPQATCDPALFADYAGEYSSLEGTTYTVASADGALCLSVNGKQVPARPIGKDAFAISLMSDETAMVFLRNAAGKVDGLALGFRVISKVSA